jgi:hypothetical protein
MYKVFQEWQDSKFQSAPKLLSIFICENISNWFYLFSYQCIKVIQTQTNTMVIL